MFKISNLKFGICLVFSISYLVFSASVAHAGLILAAPKYIGLNSGLVGFWSFDGKDMAGVTAYDRSGNANNGTLTNGPVRTIGKIGQALNFDGTNDYINAGAGASLSITGPVSICAWVRADALPGIEHAIVGTLNESTGDQHYTLSVQTDGSVFFFWSNAWNYEIWRTGSGLITTKKWQHICGVRISDSDVRIFIDGSGRSVSNIGDFSIPVASGNLLISDDTSDYDWHGSIDDVRVYNRALSGDEIKRLYRIGATLKVNTSINNDSLTKGLVGYWTMNAPDVAGTTAYDRSGNSKNGSFLGQDISAQGLVGWWKLDGASSGSIANGTTVGLEDSSGQSNNGTASNANGTGMAWTTAKIGVGAVNFDGVDDYVNIGGPASLTNILPFSIAVWMKTPAGVDTYRAIVGESGQQEFTKYWGQLNYYDNGDNIGTATLSANTWYHAVLTVTATTKTLYLNGAVDGTFTTGSFNSFTVNAIGQNGASGEYYDSTLDDVRIYNRALSASEVAQLYSYGLPRFVPTAGRIGQGVDSTQSYVNPGNVSSSVNSFLFWMRTASSSPTVNLLDLNASQNIKIVAGTVTASGITSPSIFVDGVSGSTVNAGWHNIAVTTGTAVNASAVNLGLNATTTAPLDGVLDDVRFYNRVINNNEIKRLYRIGATLKINTDVSRDNPDLERGLVGYWSFNDNDMAQSPSNTFAMDRSGNGNNGTLTNGPTRAIGRIGQGMSFDGSNDYVDINSSIGQFGTGDFSIAQWLKAPPLTTVTQVLISNRQTDCGSSAFWGSGIFGTEDAKDGFILEVMGSGGTNYNNVQTALIVADGSWHHVVTTRVGATLTLYRDGALVTSSTGAGTANVSSGVNTRFGISACVPGGRAYLNGAIDDVRVYNRALSADEIKRLYNLGR